MASLLIALIGQGAQLTQEALQASPVPLLFSLFDLLALGWLHYNQRLCDCFLPDDHQL